MHAYTHTYPFTYVYVLTHTHAMRTDHVYACVHTCTYAHTQCYMHAAPVHSRIYAYAYTQTHTYVMHTGYLHVYTLDARTHANVHTRRPRARIFPCTRAYTRAQAHARHTQYLCSPISPYTRMHVCEYTRTPRVVFSGPCMTPSSVASVADVFGIRKSP